MSKSRYSDEQIAAALRQAEAGMRVLEIVRKLGISEAGSGPYSFTKYGPLKWAGSQRQKATAANSM